MRKRLHEKIEKNDTTAKKIKEEMKPVKNISPGSGTSDLATSDDQNPQNLAWANMIATGKTTDNLNLLSNVQQLSEIQHH